MYLTTFERKCIVIWYICHCQFPYFVSNYLYNFPSHILSIQFRDHFVRVSGKSKSHTKFEGELLVLPYTSSYVKEVFKYIFVKYSEISILLGLRLSGHLVPWWSQEKTKWLHCRKCKLCDNLCFLTTPLYNCTINTYHPCIPDVQ